MGIVGDIGGAIGGTIGYFSGGKDRKRERQMYEDAIREMQGLYTPNTETRMDAYQTGPSAWEGVYSDARLGQDQRGVLDDLIARGQQTGLGVQDKIALREAKFSANQNESAQRQAILQQMAMRGLAGSGQELAASLGAQQGAANRVNQMAGGAAAAAADRRYDATLQAGSFATNMRNQDFGEKGSRASALDSVAGFNASQRRGAYNDAFSDSYQKAAGTNAARYGAAGMYADQEKRRTQAYAGMGKGVGSAGDAALAGANPQSGFWGGVNKANQGWGW